MAPSRLSRPLLLVFLLLLAGMLGPARAVGQPGPSLRFERIGLEEGLSQATVLDVLQDRAGFLWIGTQDGLNRYDGYEFTVYRHDPFDQHSLSTSFVQTMYEDRAGTLWVGTWGGGLNRFDPATEQFTHFRHDPDDPYSLSDDIVTAIYEDNHAQLWIGTAHGLDRFDPVTGQFIHFRHDPNDPNSLSNNFIWSIAEDSSGGLWVGTLSSGLNRLMPQEAREANPENTPFQHYQHQPGDPASLLDDANVTVYVDRQGVLWAGTAQGLARYEPQRDGFTRFQHDPTDPNSLCDAIVQAIYEDQDGGLWIGTASGLCRFDRDKAHFTRYRHNPADPTSLSHDVVRSLYEDRGGTLWIGTGGGGLSKYHRATEHFGHYKHDPLNPASLNNNYVWDFQEDQTGAVWIGTDSGGLNRFDPATGQFTHFEHTPNDPHSLSDNVVLSLVEDADGFLWVGTYGGGLNRFNPATRHFTHYTYDPAGNGLSNPSVNALLADTSGVLWLGTWGGGLNRFDPQSEQFTYYRHDPANPRTLSNDLVTYLFKDRDGVLWAGTNSGGINRFDPQTGRFTRYLHDDEDPHSLSHNTVYAIHEDRAGRLWIATAGGLNRLDRATGKMTAWTTRDGLAHNIVYAMLEDEAGTLWLSTNTGLSHFDPATEQFKNYNVSDGLQSNEYNAGAAFRARNGEMYFGGINGFNRFDPRQIGDNPHVPPVVLTDVQKFDQAMVFDRALNALEEIVLSYRDNFITFEFAALDFVDPTHNQYAYMLEGVDNNWRYTDGTHRRASYTDLKGGQYRFRLKGSNSDGVWNEAGLSLPVRVIPPFWATWWFRLLAVISLVGGTLGAGLLWHRRHLQAVDQQREETIEMQRRLAAGREAERLHMARELHDGVVQDLYGVRFQLETLANRPLEATDQQRVAGAQDTLRHVHARLRDLCKDLRPPMLDSFGLAKAIRAHAKRMQEAHPQIAFTCHLDQDGHRLNDRTRLALYRIYQEAMRNALRHASAQHITVRLTFTETQVDLEVQDDGCGFAVPRHLVELARKDHLGLIGASERADAIGGTLHLDARPGHGTSLRVKAPLSDREQQTV